MSYPPCPHSYEDILGCQTYSQEVIERDYKLLTEFSAIKNQTKFCGNKILYQYQFHNLLKCRRQEKKYLTIEEVYKSPEEIKKVWEETCFRNRTKKKAGDYSHSARDMWQVFNLNRGAIVFFKASTAKYLYKKYNASSVLDITAGWGGRMLGASSLGIKYTGIDTNRNLREGYDKMRKDLGLKKKDYAMKWGSCLYFDFSKIDYDFALTSPPYINMELYENMKPFENDKVYYREFLIPVMNKCYKHLKIGGHMCFNISPKMFKALMKHGYREPDYKEDMRQQMGKQYKTKSQDMTYIWTKTQKQVDISFEKELNEMLEDEDYEEMMRERQMRNVMN